MLQALRLAKVAQTVGNSEDLWERAETEADNEHEPTLKHKQDLIEDSKERWMVMLITVAGCLAFKNDAVGFLAGLIWHWTIRVPDWIERFRHSRGSVRLRQDAIERTK